MTSVSSYPWNKLYCVYVLANVIGRKQLSVCLPAHGAEPIAYYDFFFSFFFFAFFSSLSLCYPPPLRSCLKSAESG